MVETLMLIKTSYLTSHKLMKVTAFWKSSFMFKKKKENLFRGKTQYLHVFEGAK